MPAVPTRLSDLRGTSGQPVFLLLHPLGRAPPSRPRRTGEPVSVSAVLHRNRRLAAGLLTAVAVAALAACGSNDSAGGSSSGNGNGAGNGNAGGNGRGGQMAAYLQCLSQNGVTITMPSGGPNGA